MSQQLNVSRRSLNITLNFLWKDTDTDTASHFPSFIATQSIPRTSGASSLCAHPTLTVDQLTSSRFHGFCCASSISNPNYKSWVSSDFLQVVPPKVLFSLKLSCYSPNHLTCCLVPCLCLGPYYPWIVIWAPLICFSDSWDVYLMNSTGLTCLCYCLKLGLLLLLVLSYPQRINSHMNLFHWGSSRAAMRPVPNSEPVLPVSIDKAPALYQVFAGLERTNGLFHGLWAGLLMWNEANNSEHIIKKMWMNISSVLKWNCTRVILTQLFNCFFVQQYVTSTVLNCTFLLNIKRA